MEYKSDKPIIDFSWLTMTDEEFAKREREEHIEKERQDKQKVSLGDYFEELVDAGASEPLTDEELARRHERNRLFQIMKNDQKLGAYGYMEPHQIHDKKVLLVDKNVGTTYRNEKQRKRVRNKHKLVYEPIEDWFFIYKSIDWGRLTPSQGRWVEVLYLKPNVEGRRKLQEHKYYRQYKHYEKELGRELSFDEMQSHCVYKTIGLLGSQQKEIKETYGEHDVVIAFKESLERIRNGEKIEILDHYRTNRWGYIVPIGS